MRLKTAILLGLMGSLQAMQEENIDSLLGSEGQMPLLKLARLKQRGDDVEPVDSQYTKYMMDAGALITEVRLFERQFPKAEISKALKYYADTYPESYDRFLSRIRNVKVASGLEGDSEDKIAIDFLLVMYEFRFTNAHEHKAAKEELVVAKIGLEGDKAQLQEQQEAQVQRTKYANWRAYGAVAAGFALTLITGLTTYFAHPVGTPANASTTTPAP